MTNNDVIVLAKYHLECFFVLRNQKKNSGGHAMYKPSSIFSFSRIILLKLHKIAFGSISSLSLCFSSATSLNSKDKYVFALF